jgi:NAD(P)-dependent dehydrogenase (short-subunit alcohol dehydrogenase family)
MTSNSKVALVTGGGRGIGLGICDRLVDEGYDIAFCGVRDASQVRDTIARLEESGRRIHYCKADISLPSERDALVDSVRDAFGQLDLLVNNAGVAPRDRKDILEATEESYEWVMKVNLQGPYFLTQRVANWMIEQKSGAGEFQGCIINVTSISSTAASPNRGEYCISKAGLTMASKLWAVRLAEFGIPVYEVRPGVTATDMTAGVKEKYDDLIAEGLLLQPRWGTPADVGRAVAALARGELPYSTGQVVMVDGGFSVERL